jgi:adenosylcobinamide-phosphate synthase
MIWLALLAALLLGAWKPDGVSAQAHTLLARWVDAVARQRLVPVKPASSHAGLVVVFTVAVPTVLVGAFHGLLTHASSLLGLLFQIAVLVACLGAQAVRQRFLAIRDALDREETNRARSLLGQWMGCPPESLARHDLVRSLASHALVQAHRQVLGVMFAFIALAALGLGPAGAVLYRLACLTSQRSGAGGAEAAAPRVDQVPGDTVIRDDAAAPPEAGGMPARRAHVARVVLDAVDHVPSRLTAVGFAVVGHFDQAVTVWRRDAALWDDAGAGVVLAAAGGAAGVDLSSPAASDAGAEPAAGLPPASLAPLAALVSRSVLLWMLVLALLTLANVIG